jgi:exopolysaccharide biosynthesis polyprenyl glycosylphosphotransferase
MLKQHARLIDTGLRLMDFFTLVLALWVSSAMAASLGPVRPSLPFLDQNYSLLTTVLLAWLAASRLTGLYTSYRTLPLTTEVLRVVSSTGIVALVACLAALVWRDQAIAMAALPLYPASALLLLVAGRVLIRRSASLARRHGYNTRRFAVVGQGELAEKVVASFATDSDWGYSFAGYVLEDGAVADEGSLVLGRLADFGTILQNEVLDEVAFAVPSERMAVVQDAAKLCEQQGISFRILVDVMHGRIARLQTAETSGLPILAYSTVPTQEIALAAKRAIDLLVSASVLILLSPLLLAIAVAIKLESRGPVLFRQRRVGLNGREFDLFKFRSMHQDAEAQLSALRTRNEANGPVFKMRNDPRVTRVGHFLRRSSLDEFPQFWNVLLGEMSIVGPRPPLPTEVRQYRRWQRRRLSVRPGLTCTWQISGRSEIPFDQWMELDLEYIDTWSLVGDLQICAMTIPAVLTARGAR